MANSVYVVNKGINRPIEFKGLKAQYIWYVAFSMLGLLIFYAILFIAGVNQYLALVIVLMAGGFALMKIYGLSNKYGEHGMMKVMARRSVPKVIVARSRKIFINGLKGKIKIGK
ncbi:DUF4133 domain-containing protein [Chitinophaga sancti]|uniref:DUF4133 domain-containing protein n=1 Tax=Chitinophaga sancti TaxID=1004 RepID=UPI002A75AD5F|nr:DUF4133 domain-containing protein [Chitinophaga sancti]WPQ61927.1 DUF4133 domain-containing protein [Chitinophaga sancti]